MGIGQRIRMIRGSLRQDAFAQKLGIHQNTVGRWEREQRIPDLQDLNKILALFPDINSEWLLSGEGPMNKGESEPGQEGYADKKLLMAKKFRIIRGNKTIQEFCREFRWHEDDWWRIEEDIKCPSWVLLYRICTELGISPTWLIEDKGPMLKADVPSAEINTALLKDILKEIEVHEAINPGSLSLDKKADLIGELYKLRTVKGGVETGSSPAASEGRITQNVRGEGHRVAGRDIIVKKGNVKK